MISTRFNKCVNAAIAAALLLIGGFSGYEIAHLFDQKGVKFQQYSRKVMVASDARLALEKYRLCMNQTTQAPATTLTIDCDHYAGELDINLMAANAYFTLDRDTQKKIETILNRSDMDKLDATSQTLTQQVLNALNQAVSQEKIQVGL